jgi:hypothetical protein
MCSISYNKDNDWNMEKHKRLSQLSSK